MKTLLLIMLICLSFNSFARVYIAGSVSSVKQVDTSDDGDANKDLLLEGTGGALYLGYRYSFMAFEVFSKAIKTESSEGSLEFDLEDSMTGLGIRLYIFNFVNLKLGTIKHDASGDLVSGSTTLMEYESTSNGSYAGLGLKFGMKYFELFVDFTQYASEHDTIDNSGILFHDFELGARISF